MGEENPRRDMTQPIKRRRPFLLTIMLWMYLLWILLGWLRFAGAIRNQDLILSLASPGLRIYLLAAGLIWGLAGLPVVWGMVTRSSWTPLLILITSVLYPGVYWFERLFLWQDPDAGRNWPFMLLLTLLWLGLAFGALRLKQVRQYFKDDHRERR